MVGVAYLSYQAMYYIRIVFNVLQSKPAEADLNSGIRVM